MILDSSVGFDRNSVYAALRFSFIRRDQAPTPLPRPRARQPPEGGLIIRYRTFRSAPSNSIEKYTNTSKNSEILRSTSTKLLRIVCNLQPTQLLFLQFS